MGRTITSGIHSFDLCGLFFDVQLIVGNGLGFGGGDGDVARQADFGFAGSLIRKKTAAAGCLTLSDG